jgi:dienelactone hydrolase
MTTRGRLVGGLVLAATAILIGGAPYLAATAALLDLAGHTTGLRRWLPIGHHTVTTTDISIPTRYGPVAGRVYSPAGAVPTAVVFPGIHGGGVDAPRLVRLCSRLAGTGVRVVCIPLPDLREFRVTSRSTDMIEDATIWVSDQQALTGERRIGLVGVSFAGGLALVAAGRPSLTGRLTAVVSIGGHGDLARTLRFLTSGVLPDGSRRAPHDYGLAVVALAATPQLVPPAVRDAFSRAVRTYLEASLDDSPTHERFLALLAKAKDEARQLPDPERTIALAITDRNVATVGRWLEPALPALAADAALSPERSPPANARVFLLHGRDDNVIPSSETPLVAGSLMARGNPGVRWLLTSIISHAEPAGRPGWREAWALVRFWRDAMGAMGG